MVLRPTTLFPEPVFLTPYLQVLKNLGVRAAWHRRGNPKTGQGEPTVDAWLTLEGPWGEANWACEHKPRLERTTLGPVLAQMKQLQKHFDRAVLLTTQVRPPLAEELRQHDIPFVDLAGNAFLRDEGLYVWATGRTATNTGEAGRRRALHTAGLKLLFVLLQQRTHPKNLRDLAGQAGVALGGTGQLLRELERREWIRRKPDGIEVADPNAMLEQWDEGYAETLRPKLFAKACRLGPKTTLEDLPERLAANDLGEQVRIGGELGAALLTRHLRPAKATLHFTGIDAPEIMRRLDLVPDRAGDILLVRAFGRRTPPHDELPAAPELVDPLLIRGELLVEADPRLLEVAELVRKEHIVPRWT